VTTGAAFHHVTYRLFFYTPISKIFGWLFAFALLNVVFLYLALAFVCIIKALRGERWAIPFLGDLVEKI
jgi:uncharacterized membrane protein